MKNYRSIGRFTKGLITDRLGVDGALLEADDIVPLDRAEGFRVRNGKTLTDLAAASGSAAIPGTFNIGSRFSWSSASLQINSAALIGALDIALNPFQSQLASVLSNGQTYVLPRQAFDAAGAALALSGGRNNAFLSDNGSAFKLRRELWIPGGDNLAVRYAGALAGSAFPYSTGTVSGTAGATLLTGAGTTWTSAMEGGYVYINVAGTQQRPYRIEKVLTGTTMILDRTLAVVVAAATTYRISAIAGWFCKPGTFGGVTPGAAVTTFSTVMASGGGAHQGRAIVWGIRDADGILRGDRYRWSAVGEESDGTGWGGPEYFHSNAYGDLDMQDDQSTSGSGIIHGLSWRGAFYFLRADGMYVLRGNLETDGRDAGASVEFIGQYSTLWQDQQPVATPEGIWFLTLNGLMLYDGSTIRNFTDETLVGGFYRTQLELSFTAGFPTGAKRLSITPNRIIVQGNSPATNALPNTMVFWRQLRVWTTQHTYMCARVVVDAQGVERALTGKFVASSGARHLVNWSDDMTFTAPLAETSSLPRMVIQTHPVKLTDKGALNGRIRAAQVRAKIVDSAFNDPVLGVSVLLGEQGYDTAVEAAIAGSISAAESTQTEKWYRLPIRAGSSPVDCVRLRFVQTNYSPDLRVMEAGVEHVPVARFRP